MRDLKQFFARMNDVSFIYVVLRNFDRLPHSVVMGPHSDLDLLVSCKDQFEEIFPDAQRVYPSPRVQFKQPIGDSFVQIDVRYVGDNYYPKNFENEILRHRVWNKNGFFTPNKILHLVALSYHCTHHKNSNTYPDILGNAMIPELLDVLQNTGVGWVMPDDPTVGAYNSYLQGATSVVEKSDGSVVKKQVSYEDFSLLKNEARLLERCNSSKHIPNLLKRGKEEIELEDCGEHLTVDNLPEDWMKQLVEIIKDLCTAGIKHNDIKLANLMVKDGIIKLIDFGWGSLEEEDISHFPKCLGQPNRYFLGPNDNYAMKAVIRQIKYMIDEKGGGNDE